MKLGSLKEGGRDGTLIVVNRALTRAVRAANVAPTLQRALDDWAAVEPKLQALAAQLENDKAPGTFAVDTTALAAPLPRAYQWADGSAYVVHVELVRKARGVEMPPSFWTDPLMYQGGSDSFTGPNDAIEMADEAWGIDFEGEIGVIVDDVPMGVSAQAARKHIKLVTILNDVSLRNLIVTELAKGFGFFHGKPATAFAPVAVTPDELGDAWDGGKVNLPLISTLNGKEFGHPNAATDLTFDFGQLIAHAARTRHLEAGTVVGSGTVANRDAAVGCSCIAERRVRETIDGGKAVTPFMSFGDQIRIEMFDRAGKSIFGAIDQKVVRYTPPT
ncbi:fumarylacetoacetate hydrolase family protein [Reyranella sp.]|uniref:fumarylacetoacetate hydrolase family protein n=1 Tax=Reyranella sp. TaxID=1929291 RepID=UPI0012026820|nr:fumarylacetoacetate hydrolase family protein [Reyranella sp.]TAJ84905.1 MAG: FAA hydrolase family protein [Reyranella sp.]